MLQCKDSSGEVQMLLKPTQPPLLCSTQQITSLCEHAIGTCDAPFTGTEHIHHMRSVGYHLYTAGWNIYFSCLHPPFWLGQYFIIFLIECLPSRVQKEKNEGSSFIFKLCQIIWGMKQNGKEQSACCDGPPWILKTSGCLHFRQWSIQIPPHLASAQPLTVAGEGCRGILGAWVSMSLWGDLTAYTSETTWEMGTQLKSAGQPEGHLHLEPFLWHWILGPWFFTWDPKKLAQIDCSLSNSPLPKQKQWGESQSTTPAQGPLLSSRYNDVAAF